LIAQRRRAGRSWYCDETYLKVKGRGVYLYRAIDRNGNLVDVLLSERQDQAAAEAFFRSARAITGSVPDRVTTDGRRSYPGAIKTELGESVIHREVWSIGVERKRMALPWMISVHFSFDQTRTLSMTLISEGVGIICVSRKPAAVQSV
jgi:transposase-like protein